MRLSSRGIMQPVVAAGNVRAARPTRAWQRQPSDLKHVPPDADSDTVLQSQGDGVMPLSLGLALCRSGRRWVVLIAVLPWRALLDRGLARGVVDDETDETTTWAPRAPVRAIRVGSASARPVRKS